MRIDLILEPHGSSERWAELAQLAESYGIGALWVSNMHDGRDPFINFVDAARATSKIKMGPVAISPYELHPLKMGNALLTLNEISKGRAQIGVAAGDGGTAYAMGKVAKRRLRAVKECVEIIDTMSTGKLVKYHGEMYEVKWYQSTWVTQSKPGVFVCAGGPVCGRNQQDHHANDRVKVFFHLESLREIPRPSSRRLTFPRLMGSSLASACAATYRPGRGVV